ncbi:MAG: ATP-grasp domain-containing protein [Acidobacteriota bacterium]
MVQQYDLGLAWNWEFDQAFIFGLEAECRRTGLTTYRIEPHNLSESLRLMRSGKLAFRTFLDRASDGEEFFLPLERFLTRSETHMFNPYEAIERAKDKATMHLELMTAGINVPYTIIISPYSKKKEIELSLSELAQLGRPFIIKPANTTGGGIGVIMGAETLKEVIESRQHHKGDKYLLQETVVPATLQANTGWFRVFYAFGETLLCWWDTVTHIYRAVTEHEEYLFGLRKLHEIATTIHMVCGLDFFSTEIAVTRDGRFVTVDYVNEICDMRAQSQHVDGVPDGIIAVIQRACARAAKHWLESGHA